MTRRRLAWAAGLSLLAYAIPLASAHWMALLGTALVAELGSGRPISWIAADFGLAFLLQILLFAAAWIALPRGRKAAAAVCLVLMIPFTWAANIAYMVGIPSIFLIESDDGSDQITWTEACSVRGYSLDPAPAGITRGLERNGAALVRNDKGDYALMRMPDCRLEPVKLPRLPILPGVQRLLPDGSIVFSTMERNIPGQKYWFQRTGSPETVPLAPPAAVRGFESTPLVSSDGNWAAWITRDEDRKASVSIVPIGQGSPSIFTHDLLQRTTLVLVELDIEKGELVINRGLSSFAGLSLKTGSVLWGPLNPDGLAAQSDTFRYSGGQWLGWDAYVEDRPYKVAWSTRIGHGNYQVPRGRLVTSAALDPAGRYIAVSTTTSLNIGSFGDTVLVLPASGSKPAFRRNLPRYARSQVAFLSDRYFVYSGIENSNSVVHALALP